MVRVLLLWGMWVLGYQLDGKGLGRERMFVRWGVIRAEMN